MVEFALVLIVLLMIVLGVIQFGLCWYTKYALACASREGARYGVLYKVDANGNRILPNALDPSIEDVVRDQPEPGERDGECLRRGLHHRHSRHQPDC